MASKIQKRVGKAQAREEFSTLIESVAKGGGAVEITDYGKVSAVLVSEEEYAWLRSCEKRQKRPRREARGFLVLEDDLDLEKENRSVSADFDKSIERTLRKISD
ncbi:MAG TPA: type II toxin-antitoxin system Phd/YefM family antitoxin [Candidatus Melainabacteria bacterium]|jgi:prevent-host-death family protein|nr:type II toxin-antitoxin system Phd/YefM family antitoxin [Candidatus Melainabacteria bacterium]